MEGERGCSRQEHQNCSAELQYLWMNEQRKQRGGEGNLMRVQMQMGDERAL